MSKISLSPPCSTFRNSLLITVEMLLCILKGSQILDPYQTSALSGPVLLQVPFFLDPHECVNLSSTCSTVAMWKNRGWQRGQKDGMSDSLHHSAWALKAVSHRNQFYLLLKLMLYKHFWWTVWIGQISYSSFFFFRLPHPVVPVHPSSMKIKQTNRPHILSSYELTVLRVQQKRALHRLRGQKREDQLYDFILHVQFSSLMLHGMKKWCCCGTEMWR